MKEMILIYVVSLINLLFLFLVFYVGIKIGHMFPEKETKKIQYVEKKETILDEELDDELEKHFGDLEQKKKVTNIILSNLDNYDGDIDGLGQEDIPI